MSDENDDNNIKILVEDNTDQAHDIHVCKEAGKSLHYEYSSQCRCQCIPFYNLYTQYTLYTETVRTH